MSVSEREKMHYDLLDALYTARKQVEYLEAAPAHNAAFLGTGVERENQIGTAAPKSAAIPDALVRYLDLVEPETDISDYIGREGHDESRPRLGPDAPASLRPKTEPGVSPLVGQLALGHPSDAITFGPPRPAPQQADPASEDISPGISPASPARPSASQGAGVRAVLDGDALPPVDSGQHWQDALSMDEIPMKGFAAGAAPERRPAPPAAPAGGERPSGAALPQARAPEPGAPLAVNPAARPSPRLPASRPPPPSAGGAFSGKEPRMPCDALNDDECSRSCLALQAINEGIWDWNVRTGAVYRSSRWLEIIGPPPEGVSFQDALGELVFFIHPADAEHVRARLEELLEGRACRVFKTVRFQRGEGWGWGILRAVSLRRDERTLRITAVLADITAQREAEIALRASDEKFRALAEDSPDVIGRFDRDGTILYASPNVARYSPLAPEEIVGRKLDQFDLSGEADIIADKVGQVFTSGQPVQAELVLFSPLVGEFVTDCRFWPEFGVDGEVVSVSVQARDMTHARRLAENYYALFNNMDDGFILFEHLPGWEGGPPRYSADEFALVVMNPAFSRMFKVGELEHLIGVRASELLGDDADQWAACLGGVLTGEKSVMQPLSSGISPGEYDVSAYSPEQGRVACIVKDVTELHRIEQEIRLNEARLAALHRLSHMDAAPEDRVVRYCLEQAVKLTGSSLGYLFVSGIHESDSGHLYWSHEVQSRHGGESLPDSADGMPWRRDQDCRVIRGPEVVNVVEGGFSSVFGGSVEVSRYMLAPVTEEGRIACMAGVANKKDPYTPSDLRQLELFINGIWFHLRRRWSVQSLRNAKDAAEAASKAKNEFLANVSHELRTPLNGILGLLQVLQQSRLTEEQMECVNTAAFSGRSLLRIISDILDFSRIEAGIFELSAQVFDFSATVRSALGMFIPLADHGQIRFTLHLDKRIPKLLVGDDARLRQIIINLVGNAFKFTQQGEISVECSPLPFCRKDRRCIYLVVRDTGIGIPEAKLQDIFKAFTQLDGSSTRRYPGTGLGLAIVQRLVHLMEGTLAVESSPGGGTAIHCSLPFAEPSQPDLRTMAIAVPPQSVEPLDLLVVEDDQVNQFTLRTLLKKIGHSAVCVNDGKQAIEALSLRHFDAVVTDIQMPIMDGMEMTRRIRQGDTWDVEITPDVIELLGLKPDAVETRRAIPKDIPIIALTAHAMEGDKERFLGMGMDYYLAKPVIAAELAGILAHFSSLLHARKE